jgi:LTXXQ motif family protein
MRQIHLRSGTALALVLAAVTTTALMTSAMAQQKKDEGRAAPAQAVRAAPQPHIAAPAPTPHITQAPQVAVQHNAAPTHVETPHIAVQQNAHQNIVRSNGPSTATSAVRERQIEAHHVETRRIEAHRNDTGAHNKDTGAHNLAHRGSPTTPTVANSSKTTPSHVNNAAAAKVEGPNKANQNKAISNTATPNTATTKLPGERGNRDRNAVNQNAANQQALTKAQEQEKSQARARLYVAGHKPVLQNQTFANLSARDPAMRALAHATFQGKFAQFHDRDRHDRFWDRRGFHGIVIGWGGPVFWPYAYADLVDYTFWPYANDTFWPYAYDDVYDGIFGAYAPDATAYADVPVVRRRLAPQAQVATGLAAGGMAQVCSGQTTGLTDWPIERIAQQVGPTDAQRSLLDRLKDATARAVDLMKSACPTDLPSTPTGRLAAMRQRIEPMLQAVQIVRPALDNFYQSLSDEQKERFISLESEGAPKATRAANRQQPNLAQACGGSEKQIAGLPINQIQQLLHPNDTQQAALQELNNASNQAAALLNENCAQDQALTPPGRVAAMETRLSAMLKALNTVQPAIAKFYNSLTDEQKARFDRIGPRQG